MHGIPQNWRHCPYQKKCGDEEVDGVWFNKVDFGKGDRCVFKDRL